MDPNDYEYRGLLASSWDLLRGDTSDWPDRPFYRAIILDDGQPALDVGCGTGRLLLDYLADGIDVDGMDLSPEMLETAGYANVRAVSGFSDEPTTADDDVFCIFGTRPFARTHPTNPW